MSREQSGKSPIFVLACRFSFFIVTPMYLFILFIFSPWLRTQSFFGAIFYLLFWWVCTNLGGFSLAVFLAWPVTRFLFRLVYQNRLEYIYWLQHGGDPFWDMLPWPINPDSNKVRMAITAPPDYDTCPNDGWPMGRRFGNQCRYCGLYHDKQ